MLCKRYDKICVNWDSGCRMAENIPVEPDQVIA